MKKKHCIVLVFYRLFAQLQCRSDTLAKKKYSTVKMQLKIPRKKLQLSSKISNNINRKTKCAKLNDN